MPRKRRTKEEWKATIEAQKASGLSAPQYCAKHDCNGLLFLDTLLEVH